jgi:MoaA/NifB/PqqE/SkfB family radical SAM enzyme
MELPQVRPGDGSQLALQGYHWTQAELETTQPDGIFYLAMNMTSLCNYRCPYCFVGLQYLKTGKDEMTLDQKRRVIREGAECGARVLAMPGRGEPLSDPHFWDILATANYCDLYVVVYTNGYLLDEEKIKRLRDMKVSLYVKVDSLRKDVYETLVGKKGVFERVRKNLDLIVEHFHQPVPDMRPRLSRFGVNSVVTVQSAGSIVELDRWCEERSVFYTCRSPVKVGEAARTWEFLVGEHAHDLKAVGQRYADRNFTSATPKGQCGIYHYGITVENNGEIYMCPDARIDAGFGRIGSVKDTPLRELIARRAALHPINSDAGFCYVKSALNPEERRATLALPLELVSG